MTSDKPERTVDERYLLWQRNVVDKYKDVPTEDIKKDLQSKCFPAAFLISQVQGDFNISSIIRTANNFNLSKVFYYGKKHIDRRGCLGTYHYTDVIHLSSLELIKELKSEYRFVALENNIDKTVSDIRGYEWNRDKPPLILVGEENSGLTPEILDLCDDFIEIPSFGSVRSLNAAVAAS